MTRTLLTLLAGGLVAIALLLLAGVVYQILGSRSEARRYPPPGQLLRVNGHRLHILVTGEGAPSVVLDTGFPGTCLSWTYVQPEVARFARVASYDRAGLGWSDPDRTGRRTTARLVAELRELLRRAEVPPPFVLVGHSFGSFTARVFASTYPDETVGLVLVDPVDPSEWLEMPEEKRHALRKGARFCRYGAWVARAGIARLVRDMVRAGAGRGARMTTSLVTAGALRGGEEMAAPAGKLPVELRPVAHSFWVQPKFYLALAGQTVGLPESAAQVASTGGFGDLPLVVLAAGNSKQNRLAQQQEIARLSTQGMLVVVEGSDHWIQLEQPRAVVDAIRAVVEARRQQRRATVTPAVLRRPAP